MPYKSEISKEQHLRYQFVHGKRQKKWNTDLQADLTATSWPSTSKPTSRHVKHSYEKAVLAHNWRSAGAPHHTEVVPKLQRLDQDNNVKENLTKSKLELELEW